ncbi:MAG: cytochrome oxidase subunit III [Holophagae bacterium]|nr:MAG: cytochrome oxidase subunit III [Holophagae bacterium]
MSDVTTSPDPAGSRHDHLLDHAYDGIQEYDNPLPRWWVVLFWVTVAVAPLYILYFHFGPGLLSIERYDAAMIAFYDKQAEELLALGEVKESTLAGLMSDASMMNSGRKIFQSKCSPCHGMFAEGAIGPNLTDDHWLHGPQLMDVYRTVRQGVPEKGMLSWERQLRPAELLAVSSYVGSLLGSSPPNPKAPQGTLAARQPPADATPPAGTAAGGAAAPAAPVS